MTAYDAQEGTTPDADGLDAARPARRETFLARYPRNTKLAVTLVLVLALVSPVFWSAGHTTTDAPVPHASLPQTAQDTTPTETKSADTATSVTEATPTTFSKVLNDADDATVKLVPAPDPDLVEDTAEGSLPKISADGRPSWQYYARPFNLADSRPRVAIIITDLGLSRGQTDTAIDRLPRAITLAFDVQSPVAASWVGRARQQGHEVLLQVPMEPFDYPRSDPGPNTLLTSLPNVDNISRLMWDLRQGTGYVGVMTVTGSRFTTTPDKLTPILQTLGQRGLMIVDTRIAPHGAIMDLAANLHLPAVGVTEWIDHDSSPEAVDAALARLEKTAHVNGSAVGITPPLPMVLERLQLWSKALPSHGVALAPISVLAK